MARRSDPIEALEIELLRAIEVFSHEVGAALEGGQALPKLSVASFLKRFGIPRSSMYERYRAGLLLIEKCFANLRGLAQELADRRRSRPSEADLRSEIVHLRTESKRQLAKAMSVKTRDLLKSCGPAFRERAELFQDHQRLVAEVEDLTQQNEKLRSMVRVLLAQNGGSAATGADLKKARGVPVTSKSISNTGGSGEVRRRARIK